MDEKEKEKRISLLELDEEEAGHELTIARVFHGFSDNEIKILVSIDSRRGNHLGYESPDKREARIRNFRKGPEKISKVLEDPGKKEDWVRRSCLSPSGIEKSKKTHSEWTYKEKMEHLENSFLSEEAKRKAYESRRWIYSDPTIISKRAEKSKISQSKYWASLSPSERAKFGEKVSRGQLDYWASLSGERKEELRRKNSESQRGKVLSNGTKIKIGESMVRYWGSLPEEEKVAFLKKSFQSDIAIRNRMKALRQKPNGLERWVGWNLEQRYPGQWLYNGDFSQGVRVGNRLPDFVRADGKKEIISILGCLGLYHFLGDGKEEIEHYAEHGWKCHIIWEWDAHNPEALDRFLEGLNGQYS